MNIITLLLDNLPTIISLIEECTGSRDRAKRIVAAMIWSPNRSEASIKRGVLAVLEHAANQGQSLDNETREMWRNLEEYVPQS